MKVFKRLVKDDVDDCLSVSVIAINEIESIVISLDFTNNIFNVFNKKGYENDLLPVLIINRVFEFVIPDIPKDKLNETAQEKIINGILHDISTLDSIDLTSFKKYI